MPLGGTSVGAAFVKLFIDGTGLDGEIETNVDKAIDDADLDKSGQKAGKKIIKGINKGAEDESKKTRWFTDLNKKLDKFAVRTGKTFGKGSRSDLVHYFGVFTEGLTRLINLVPKAVGTLASFAGEGGGTNFMNFLKAAGPALVKFGGAAFGTVGVVQVLTGGLSSLSAAAIGIVSSFAFAAGAVGGLAFSLGTTLFLAVGVAILALKNLDEKTTKALDGMKDKFSDLGKSAGKAIGPGLRKAIEIVSPAIDGLKKPIDAIAGALGNVAVSFAKITESPAYRKFIRSITDFLPGAIESLGEIGANFGKAFMGIFRALEPLTTRFLTWLTDTSDRFATWTNSVKGQNQLKKFFKEAGDSARVVGEFIGAAAKALGTLFSKGKGSGDTILADMTKQLKSLTDWLKDPKNQKAIASFFEDGIKVARRLGNVFGELIGIIDELDNNKTRTAFRWLLTSLEYTLKGVRLFLKALGAVQDVSLKLWQIAGDHVMGWVDLILSIPGKVSHVWDSLKKNASKAVSAITGFFRKLPGRIVNAVQKLPGQFGRLMDRVAYLAGFAVGRIVRFFVQLPGKVAAAAVGLVTRMANLFTRVVNGIPGVISKIVGFFRDLPGRIVNAVGDLWGKLKSKFTAVVTGVRTLVGEIVSSFTGLAGKVLSAIGTIDIGSLIKWPAGKAGQLAKNFVEGVGDGFAAGGIVTGPTRALVGEAGREAIVPLSRPLAQVDPSVRALSAIAQGKTRFATGGVVGGPQKNVYNTFNLDTPTSDPRAIAVEVLNRAVAVGAF